MLLGGCDDAERARRGLDLTQAVIKSSPGLFVPDGIQKPRILVFSDGAEMERPAQHVIGSRAKSGSKHVKRAE